VNTRQNHWETELKSNCYGNKIMLFQFPIRFSVQNLLSMDGVVIMCQQISKIDINRILANDILFISYQCAMVPYTYPHRIN